MTLYHKSDRRLGLYVIIAVILAVSISIIFFMLNQEPNPVDEAKTKLFEMKSSLDLLLIEYSEAVENGRVVYQSEYRVSLKIVDNVIERYNEVKDLLGESYDLTRLGDMLSQLETMVKNRESPEDVEDFVYEIIRYINEILEEI